MADQLAAIGADPKTVEQARTASFSDRKRLLGMVQGVEGQIKNSQWERQFAEGKRRYEEGMALRRAANRRAEAAAARAAQGSGPDLGRRLAARKSVGAALAAARTPQERMAVYNDLTQGMSDDALRQNGLPTRAEVAAGAQPPENNGVMRALAGMGNLVSQSLGAGEVFDVPKKPEPPRDVLGGLVDYAMLGAQSGSRPTPYTDEGKIRADAQAGYLSEDEAQAAISGLSAPEDLDLTESQGKAYTNLLLSYQARDVLGKLFNEQGYTGKAWSGDFVGMLPMFSQDAKSKNRQLYDFANEQLSRLQARAESGAALSEYDLRSIGGTLEISLSDDPPLVRRKLELADLIVATMEGRTGAAGVRDARRRYERISGRPVGEIARGGRQSSYGSRADLDRAASRIGGQLE